MSVAEAKIMDVPPLAIACKKCGGNAGRIENGTLVYSVKHSGEHHTIRIDLQFLEKLLRAGGK